MRGTDVAIQRDVGAGQHAVAVDVGTQQVAQAANGITPQQVVEGFRCGLGPAVHRQAPYAIGIAARIERDGDRLAAEFADPREHAGGVAHCQRTDHDAGCAGIEQCRHVIACSYSTAGLHLQGRRRGDVAQQWPQGVAAGLGGVQVDQVQPRGAGIGIAPGEGQRIVAVAGFLGIVALAQAHHAALAHVDRGIDGEPHAPFHRRKFESKRAPTVAERSGWNCAPATTPRCTIAAKRSPCVQAAMQSAVTGAA